MNSSSGGAMRRLWQSCSRRPAPDVPAGAHKIRMVTYNILADKYSSFNSYCPPQFLSWQYRYPKLLAELELYAADLLFLQEVESTVFDQQLQPWMQQRGYNSLFQPRRSPQGSPGPDEGVSLHFRAAAFTQISSARVRLGDASVTGALLPAACCSRHRHNRFLQALGQREEGCVMALLRHEPSQQQLLAVSTHLFWNPLFPDVKVAQAALLCSSIARFLQGQGLLPSQVPTVVGGDFNSIWQKYSSDQWDQVAPGQPLQSGVYQLMQQGQLTAAHQHHPAHRTCSNCSSSSSSSKREQQQGSWQQQTAAQLAAWQQEAVTQQGFAGQLWGGSVDSSMEVDSVESSVDEDAAAAAGGVSSSDGSGSRKGARNGRGNAGGSSSSTLVDYSFHTSELQLDSSYYMAHGREPPLTTRTNRFSGTLDYLWLSKQHWQVTSTLAMPYNEPQEPAPPESVADLPACPNEVMPSDHLAVGCEALLLPVAA